jgi:hypothetical protein
MMSGDVGACGLCGAFGPKVELGVAFIWQKLQKLGAAKKSFFCLGAADCVQ